MTPEQLGILTALFGLVDKMSGWPVWVVILIILMGPWMMTFIFDRNHERRLVETWKMYDRNVVLLKETQSIAKDLKELVIVNTQAMQSLTDDIEKNQFCPMVRQAGRGG